MKTNPVEAQVEASSPDLFLSYYDEIQGRNPASCFDKASTHAAFRKKQINKQTGSLI